MNTRTDPIAERVAALPITPGEREEALAYIAEGEGIAQLFLAVADLFQLPQAPRHSH